jgi:DNA repair protein SbcD/Mre11
LTLRILHTSDWHLGSSLESASRDEEHRRFLEWLLVTLRDEAIDVLLVAGDVFQYAQPSAEAQRLYYRFLSRVGRETSVRQIVVIGGNHDSASRLDAPREVLDALRIHVVGGLVGEQASWDRCLCPIERPGGGVDAVVLAVPFVHEFRLGIRTTGRSPAEITADFREAFSNLYRHLADLAEQRWPGAPLIATGHLTCVGAQAGEYGTEIHQVGTIGGLPGDIFDPRLEYIALGHIHRMFPVEGTRARYSGSPLAMNVVEARSQRFVIRIELDPSLPAGQRATTHKILVPTWREIIEISGPTEVVLGKLRALQSTHELPPFVYVSLEVDEYLTDGPFRVNEAIETHPLETRPRVVEVHQKVAGREDVPSDGAERTSLRGMKPEDVFVRLYQQRFQQALPGDLLLTAFRTVLSQLDEPPVAEERGE